MRKPPNAPRYLPEAATRFSLGPRRIAYWRVNRVYWLSILGIVLWTIFAASGKIPGTPPIDLKPFLVVLILACTNLGLRSYERFRREQDSIMVQRHLYGWIFVTVDLVLIAAGLRFTGGLESPLWVVLFLVGVSETILTTWGEAHVILGFGIAALLFGTFPFPPTSVDSGYFLEIALRGGLFYAVSSVTRRLRENSDTDKREVASLRAELTLAEERTRLSREVHDGVGNSLAAAVLRLEVAARTLEKQVGSNNGSNGSKGGAGSDAVHILRDEAQALRDAMTSVRDWTFFTRPWGSEPGATAGASFEAEVDRLSRRTGLPMQVQGAAELDALSPAARMTVLRIAQEALINAAKHAATATTARITLTRQGACLTLQIEDDGAGFDPAQAGAGIGLSSMRERAEGIGGTFTLHSAPGQGTHLVVTLPTV
ncbi:MAG: hypothetical protein OHK0029_07160 [Armatimonadaceae bacterium]